MKVTPIFGLQLRLADEIISARMKPLDAGGDSDRLKEKIALASQFSRLLMQIIISLIVLLGCFAILIKTPNSETCKVATALIGTVIGYWLR